MAAEEALFHILETQLANDELILPSLPEVAIKVREAVDNPNTTLAQIVDVISKDPALSLRLVRIANTAHYARAAKVNTLSAAIHRIGMRAIKNIAIAMALEQLFVCNNDTVRKYIELTWLQSVEVSAAATALFSLFKQQHNSKAISLETLTLMGLIHNIGVLPILTEAQRHNAVFANSTFLDRAIARFSSRIGGAIMEAWGFESAFAQVASSWRDLSVNPDSVNYLDFVRLGAVYAKGIKDEALCQRIMRISQHKGLCQVDASPFDDELFLTRYSEVKAAFA
jgi:HD-like signal output (HDOD) protein